jgi:sugar porter (SP) family MFS transporter
VGGESVAMGNAKNHRGLFFAVGTVALAGLLFGFDTAVIAGVTESLRAVYELSPASLGLTVSSALWGTLLGAALGGAVGDRAGSRFGLRIAAALYVVSGLGCGLAWSWGVLIAFRILAGIAIGVSSVLAPVYLAEIAPAARRGAIVGSFQINIVVGILAAYVSNAAVGALVDDPALAWRWKLGLTALPAILFQAALIFVPDSPRWLILRGRTQAAARAEQLLYGADATVEIPDVIPVERAVLSFASLWQEAKKPILLAITLGALNQLTGVNAILYYLNDIFAAAGYGRVSADVQAISVGLANLVFTLVGMLLIDRLGRRKMLIAGGMAMAMMLALAAAVMLGILPQTLLLAVLVVFIGAFAMSQGAVIWVYLSEIFPTRYRSAGQGIGSGTVWLFDALVAGIFPVAAALAPAAPFFFFMGCMVAQALLVRLYFPETKGATLEQIEVRMGTASAARVPL